MEGEGKRNKKIKKKNEVTRSQDTKKGRTTWTGAASCVDLRRLVDEPHNSLVGCGQCCRTGIVLGGGGGERQSIRMKRTTLCEPNRIDEVSLPLLSLYTTRLGRWLAGIIPPYGGPSREGRRQGKGKGEPGQGQGGVYSNVYYMHHREGRGRDLQGKGGGERTGLHSTDDRSRPTGSAVLRHSFSLLLLLPGSSSRLLLPGWVARRFLASVLGPTAPIRPTWVCWWEVGLRLPYIYK